MTAEAISILGVQGVSRCAKGRLVPVGQALCGVAQMMELSLYFEIGFLLGRFHRFSAYLLVHNRAARLTTRLHVLSAKSGPGPPESCLAH